MPGCLAACLYYWNAWDGREPELYQELGTTCDGTKINGIISTVCHLAGDKITNISYQKDLTIQQLEILTLQGFTCILNLQAWGNYSESKEEWFDPNSYNAQLKSSITLNAAVKVEIDWSQVWNDGHYVVLVEVRNDDVVLMDPSIPGRYGRMSKIDLEARWHDYGDDGGKEYHGAIIMRGMEPYNSNELVTIR